MLRHVSSTECRDLNQLGWINSVVHRNELDKNWGCFIAKGIEWSWSSRWNFIFPYQFYHWRSSSLHANLVTSLMNVRPVYTLGSLIVKDAILYIYAYIYIVKACSNHSYRASVAGGHIWDANPVSTSTCWNL